MLRGCSEARHPARPPGPQHSPISLSRRPRARVPARKQTLARRQTAPVPLRWQFFWMTLMAGGSTVSDVLTWTIWRELAARGQCHIPGGGQLCPLNPIRMLMGTVTSIPAPSPGSPPLIARGN